VLLLDPPDPWILVLWVVPSRPPFKTFPGDPEAQARLGSGSALQRSIKESFVCGQGPVVFKTGSSRPLTSLPGPGELGWSEFSAVNKHCLVMRNLIISQTDPPWPPSAISPVIWHDPSFCQEGAALCLDLLPPELCLHPARQGL
jgi:hypothetical protein